MEKFIVSARKYRPSTFDMVVGQKHITTTLKNAIKSNHLAHAFLFCGPRGVGKTTNARILAKTINCFNLTADIEPCNNCESCLSFNEGRSMNIYELDAASNNSVDDIRNLVDQVRFPPQLGNFKVYIIDEVHMLSNAAFNAFLKTLEEPPPYAKFILATTEKHKIIPTILSRCQIFDFTRITIEDMSNHLATIAGKEGITYEKAGLDVIALKADGALRDALSMFDQIVTFTGNHVTYKAVIDNLNILDYDYYFKATDFILTGSTSGALVLLDEILNNGFDGNLFLNGLCQHFRNLLVSKDVATLQLLETSQNIRDKYGMQAQQCKMLFLIEGMAICTKAESQFKISINQRLLVELALMQLCTLQGTNHLADEKKKDELKPTLPENKSAAVEPKAYAENTTTAVNQVKEPENAIPNKPSNDDDTNNSAQAVPIVTVNESASGTINTIVKPIISHKNINLGNSLNSLINKGAQKDKNTEVKPLEKQKVNAFTLDELQQSWLKFTQLIAQRGKLSLLNTLKSSLPELEDNYQVSFKVYNTVQENDINEVLTELAEKLRSDLRNDLIRVNIKAIKDDSERKPYTNKEKYVHMVQINPIIEQLRNQLDLEI